MKNENLKLVSENSFTIKSRFGELIGRGLISNSTVAVSEIVKNSYDADADNIKVNFFLNTENDKIEFVDDGEGMDYNDLVNKWLSVGTDNKINEKYTKKGRRKLGEKGIGRFAVERLGTKTTIYTKKKGSNFEYILEIDWENVENNQVNFTDVKHKIFSRQKEVDEKGTKIIISGLRDAWNEDELLEVKRQLELIVPIDINDISKYKYSLDSQVNIDMTINNSLFTSNDKIDNMFLPHYQAHLYGKILEDGSSEIGVEISSDISTNGEKVYHKRNFETSSEMSKCGPITCESFIYFKDKRLYNTFDVGKKEVDDFLKEYCGVKIYRDGFRIFPFGDPDNDWLELNAERNRSPEHRISTQNVIGIVYINRDKNPGLQDVLNRENMQDTQEFRALKKFVQSMFNEYAYVQLKNRKDKDKKEKEKGEMVLSDAKDKVDSLTTHASKIQQKLEYVNTTISDGVDSVEKQEKIVKELQSINCEVTEFVVSINNSVKGIKQAYSFYKKENEFKKREVQIYRNIATLGISAAIFGHETANRTLNCKIISEDIYDYVIKIENIKQDYLELFNDLKYINDNADFFRHYLQKEKQRSLKECNLYQICNNVVKQHQSIFESINIVPNIKCEDVDKYLIKGYQGDFYTIFTNLITNAYKALKIGGKGTFLDFKFNIEGFSIVIDVVNDGTPISVENRDKIFHPLFSTYSEGTGLGLTIISDTLELYKGKIELTKDYPETHFRIQIPLIS